MKINSSASVVNSLLERMNDRKAQLASGTRLTSAAVDAAALAIATALEAGEKNLAQANRNIADGRSMIQIADGTMEGIFQIDNRLQELSIQAANGTYSDDQRAALNAEATALVAERSRIIDSTQFNGKKVFSSSPTDIQAGISGSPESVISISTTTMESLSSIDITTAENALGVLKTVRAKQNIDQQTRASLGATDARLEAAAASNSTQLENLAAARSKLSDTDVASVTAQLTQDQTLVRMAISSGKQAAQLPNMLNRLIGA